jgi:hypothetical protein
MTTETQKIISSMSGFMMVLLMKMDEVELNRGCNTAFFSAIGAAFRGLGSSMSIAVDSSEPDGRVMARTC